MKTLLALALFASAAWSQSPAWSSVTASGAPGTNDWYKYVYDPVGHCTRVWANGGGSIIYSTEMYCIKADGTVMQDWKTTTVGGVDACPSDATVPTDRHPLGLLAVDTKRNLLWMAGGVNVNCTGGELNDLWYEKLQSSYSLGSAQLTKIPGPGNGSGGYSTGWTFNWPYFDSGRFTNTYPKNLIGDAGGSYVTAHTGYMVYDSDDDALILFGGDGGNTLRTWVYCPTIPVGGGAPTGTLSAEQQQVCRVSGTDYADRWVWVSGTGPGGATGNAFFLAGDYDSVNHVIVGFQPLNNQATWAYNPHTATWTNMAPSTQPPVNSSMGGTNWNTAALVFVPPTGKFYLHAPSATPSDWTYDYATNTWTNLGNLGGATAADTMAYDASVNSLITIYGTSMKVGALPGFASTTNTITISNPNAGTVTNQPVQIGRAFVQGEIPNGQLPQAVIAGTGIDTQVDVKNRWPDNSLKFAIISFLLPGVTYGTPVTVSFPAGNTVGNTPLTLAQMLGAGYNFDAVINANSSAKTVSARTMLQNMANASLTPGAAETQNWATANAQTNATYWTQGPIATTVIIANHTNAQNCSGKLGGTYDFGLDSYCSIRPMFEATFWPGTNQVKIRFIGENTNSEQLEDVTLSNLTLTVGNSGPTTVYTRSSPAIPMRAGTRWTKTYWLNGTPANININHNVAYLASSMLMLNYNPNLSFSGSAITNAYNTWTSSACVSGAPSGTDLYAGGEWQSSGACGNIVAGSGHDWVGPMPAWSARWLYSGDYRMKAESLGNVDLIGAMPLHFREGNASNKIDRAGIIPALGHVVSVTARPSLCYACGANFAAALSPIGTATTGPWIADVAHMPEFFTEYLLTGEHYYLDENLFWNGWADAFGFGGGTQFYYRGATGAEGGYGDQSGAPYQLRGQGWGFLSRVNTWLVVPDAAGHVMPEKTYLRTLIGDAIAFWEGERNITTTDGGWGQANNSTEWTFGYNAAFTVSGDRMWKTLTNGGGDPSPATWMGGPSPLHFWDIGNHANGDVYNSGTYCGNGPNTCLGKEVGVQYNTAAKNWMYGAVILALGRATELGFPASALLQWASVNFIGQITDAGYNPFLFGAYWTPVIKQGSPPTYYQTWAEVKAAYTATPNPNPQNETNFDVADTLEANTGASLSPNGWLQYSYPGLTYALTQAGGGSAWPWVQTNIVPLIGASKGSLLPRSIGSALAGCRINTGSLPAGQLGIAYSQTLSQSGCNASTWAIASGSLPAGLSLGGACGTGVICGTPATEENASFTVSYDTATSGTLSIGITPAIFDNFQRASLGASWTVTTSPGTFGISGSTYLMPSSSGLHLMYWNAASFGTNQFSELTLYVQNTIDSGTLGPAVRVSGTSGYMCLASNVTGALSLVRWNTGVSTSLGTASYAPTNGDLLRLEVDGSGLTCKVNGTTKIGPFTDTTYASGEAGIASDLNGRLWSVLWGAGNLGTGGTAASATSVSGAVSYSGVRQ